MYCLIKRYTKMKKLYFQVLIALMILTSYRFNNVACPSSNLFKYCATNSCYVDSNNFTRPYYSSDLLQSTSPIFLDICIQNIPNLDYMCKTALKMDFTRQPWIYASEKQYFWTNKIQPFFNQLFTDAKTTESPPSPLPTFMNNFNFSINSMPYDYHHGWISAYYFYFIFQAQILAKSASVQHWVVFQAVKSVSSIINVSSQAKWNTIKTFLNTKLQTNFTIDQLIERVSSQGRRLTVNKCLKCSAPYYPQNYQQVPQKCISCSPNCANCRLNLSCYVCFFDFVADNSNTVPGRLCNSYQSTACNSYEESINGNCVLRKSYEYCQTTNSVGCNRCRSPFSTYAYNGVCYLCQDQYCAQCAYSNRSDCLTCKTGYNYLPVNNVCIKCSQHCMVCSSQICQQCQTGYALDTVQNKCVQCIVGCYSCSISNISLCSQCMYSTSSSSSPVAYCPPQPTDEYMQYKQTISNGSMMVSVEEMLANEQAATMAVFTYGYPAEYHHVCTGVRFCKRCMVGCRRCDNYTVCVQCFQARYRNINGECKKCDDYCYLCSRNNVSNCDVCLRGYQLDTSTGKCIIPSAQLHCRSFDLLDPLKCTQCQLGYSLAVNNTCIKCDDSCLYTCQSTNITQCVHRTYPVSEGCSAIVNGMCIIDSLNRYHFVKRNNAVLVEPGCIYPCAECTSNACSKCQDNYTLLNNQCLANIACNPNCPLCPLGSQRDSNSNNCILCPLNCKQCYNGKCSSCFEGFYSLNQICLPCPARCRSCFDSQNCKVCQIGYYNQLAISTHPMIISNRQISICQCLPCDPNCRTCLNYDDFCTSCNTGQVLIDQKCVQKQLIKYAVTLGYNFTVFMNNAQQNNFIISLATRLNVNQSDISIANIKQGSTIINGTVIAQNQTHSAQLFDQMKTLTLSNYQVNDVQLQRVSANGLIMDEYNNGAITPVPPDNGGGGGGGGTNNIAMGIGIGIGVLGVVAIGVAIYLNKNRLANFFNRNKGHVDVQQIKQTVKPN